MPLDFIQLLSHFLDRLVRVEQMTLLVPARAEVFVVFERANIVVWVSAEQHPVHFCVDGGSAGPHLPELIAHGIRNEIVFGTLKDGVHTLVWRLGIRVLRSVIVLAGEEAEVLAPELAAKGGGHAGGPVRSTVHGAADKVLVFNHDGKLTVMVAKLGLDWLVGCVELWSREHTLSLILALPQMTTLSSTMHTFPCT